jgi:hypothetical protein
MSDGSRTTFTVVTPSFNQLDWLELCIASVADQEGATFVEHIVCDACSEGIENFKTRMLQRFPPSNNYRLEFFVGPDAGMYDAINNGLRHAKGDFCSYLNCDEQLLPLSLDRVANFMEKRPSIDVVFGDAVVVAGDGNALCYWRPYVPSLAHLGVATLNTLSCGTFFRRTLVDAGHFFDPSWKVSGDMMWIRDLLKAKRKMACLHEPLAVFTWLGANLGLSETAIEEFDQTRDGSPRWRRILLRCKHGVMKALSGAFVHRNVRYQIFALSSPARRQTFEAPSLGWEWPSKPTATISNDVH